MSNVTPAWMLSEAFTKAWQEMEEEKITVRQFSERLDTMPDVPEPVKQSWRTNAKMFPYLKDMRQNLDY